MSVHLKKNHLIYLIPTVIFLVVVLILNFNGLYGQDSHEYLRYSKSLSQFFTEGNPPGNFFWSVYYPLTGALISIIVFSNQLSLQLLSFASLLLSIFYLDKTLKLFYPQSNDKISIYLLIVYALSPMMLIYSQVIMSDLFCLFFITAGFYHSQKFQKELQRKDFLLAVLFMTAAILTRYAAVVVLIIPAIFMLFVFIRNFNLSTLIISLLLIIILFIPEYFLKAGNKFEMLNNIWLKNWNPANLFAASFSTPEGYFNYRFPNIIYAFYNLFHPAFIFFGIILIPFIRKEDFKNSAAKQSILCIVLYSVFIAGIPFQNIRFLLLSFPFVVVLFFKPYGRIESYLKKIVIEKLILFFVVIIQLFFYGYLFNNIYRQNKLEREISTYIKNFPGKVIYTFSIDPALRSYDVENQIINLWQERISFYKDSSLVLFNETKFAKQWSGKNPVINWKYLMANYRTKKLKQFENGWELYEIE